MQCGHVRKNAMQRSRFSTVSLARPAKLTTLLLCSDDTSCLFSH